ncbi:hypothetical protein T439DRAFT_378820 [Meredithblackwellia eburnea MCA 4105]
MLSGRAAQPGATVRRDTASINALIRDAKGLSLELKNIIKKKSDPWDREVEFQREALRKAYLQILFSPAPSKSSANLSPSKPVDPSHSNSTPQPQPPTTSTSSAHTSRLLDVINLLWLETSHAIIHVYRAKVSEMDKAIAEAPKAHKTGRAKGGHGGGGSGSGSGTGLGGGRGNNIPGPTARRRLIHSFRSFLGQEEEFFRALLSRLAVSLYPSDLPGLASLGVTVEPKQDFEDGGNVAGDSDRAFSSLSDEERAARRNVAIPLTHKALICYGDLARYRELYNNDSVSNSNGSGSSKGDHGGGGRRGRSKQDGDRKVKNWTRASECYHQARLLLPDNGNPSNQLAVLAQYSGDTLSSSYHYYRALSVRNPFPTARTNLDITYTKAINKWFADGGGEPEGDEGVKFRAAFITLQALFFRKERPADIPDLTLRVEGLFRSAVDQRLLPSDVIVKAAVTGLCALWDARMFRSAGRRGRIKPTTSSTGPSSTSTFNVEAHILIHVLSLYRTLLSIGSAETKDLVTSNADPVTDPSNFALNISAVLRRTLPALRILSKWITGQLEYMSRVQVRVEARERKLRPQSQSDSGGGSQEASDGGASEADPLRPDDLRVAFAHFWESYVEFSNTIQAAFPLESLPSAAEGQQVWLEEDVDMLGFAPLRRGIKKDSTSPAAEAANTTPLQVSKVGKDVHPNEEQLMRLRELQVDARTICEPESSFIKLDNGNFVVSVLAPTRQSQAPEGGDVAVASAAQALDDFDVDEDEDEDEEDYEMTEDDPVDLAMRVAIGDAIIDTDDDMDEEEEQIVFKPAPVIKKQGSLLSSAPTPSLPTAPPARHAGDLLQQILTGPTSSPSSAFSPSVSIPSSSATHRSIWAPTDPLSNALPSPNHPSAPSSFEAIPNTTHHHHSLSQSNEHFARQPSLSSSPSKVSLLPQPGSHISPVPSGPALARSPSLFGHFSPFAQSSPPAIMAYPISPPVHFPPAGSELSPHANPFSGVPPHSSSDHSSGWPIEYINHQQPPPSANFPPGLGPNRPVPPGFGYDSAPGFNSFG